MRPVRSAPSLFTVNGFGLGLYGKRGFDSETRTYVATRALCFFFIPIFAIGAYRVSDAPGGGWYFIGKVRLSGLAKNWNYLVLAICLTFAGKALWASYTDTPEYRMGQRLSRADALLEQGKDLEALREYAVAADSKTSHAAEGRDSIGKYFASQAFSKQPDKAAMGILQFAGARVRAGREPPSKKALAAAASALADRLRPAAPREALKALDEALPSAPDEPGLAKKRRAVLNEAVAKQPDDLDLASALGAALDEEGDEAGCERLLAPLEGRFGDRDGARVLGMLYARTERYDEAYRLLTPYCEERLKRLHALDKEFDALHERIASQAVEFLRSGKAPESWYARYKSSHQEAKDGMVDAYVNEALQRDAGLQRVREDLSAQASVVPVALDLGMVRLRRAQGMQGEARKGELEAAEKVFLSVKGIAGESDKFRVFYGQVLYWLGRSEEGRKLFDEYLDANKRNPESLVSVAGILREVGDFSAAGKMAEEAYEKEKDPAKRQSVARFRALVPSDLDDRVVWLERSNPSDPATKASLAEVRGHKAFRDGRMKEAEAEYRQAAALYEGMPKNASTLNNAALAHLSLFPVTGDPAEYRRGAAMLEEAVPLAPSDSVLLYNAAHTKTGCAVLDLTESDLDFQALGQTPNGGLLEFLYSDQAGRAALAKRLSALESRKRSLSLYRKAFLLAPKNSSVCEGLLFHGRWGDDESGLREIRDRILATGLDLEGDRKDAMETFAGKSDERDRKAAEAYRDRIRRFLALPPAAGERSLTRVVAEAVSIRQTVVMHARWGDEWRSDEVVKQAEALHAAHPSAGASDVLEGALYARLSDRLAGADAEYAAMRKKTRRSLSDSTLLLLAAERFPKLKERAAADPDLKRLLALDEEGALALPDRIGLDAWTLRRLFAPESADAAAASIRASPTRLLAFEIDGMLSPMNAEEQVSLSRLRRLQGDEEKANAVLKKAAEAGVPLPFAP